LAIVTTTAIFGSCMVWTTQPAAATSSAANKVRASPYFAGAVTKTPKFNDEGRLTQEGAVRFVVPTVTCPASGTEGYAVFQYIQSNEGFPESAVDWVDLMCSSGTFSAAMSAFACENYNASCSADCYTTISVASGDTIRFSEEDVLPANGRPPAGLMQAYADDGTSENALDCQSPTPDGYIPEGNVYTGVCNLSTGGPIPPTAPPPPPFQECMGSGSVPASTPVSLTGLRVDAKPISKLKTHEYDMDMYTQVGSTLEPTKEVKTQKVPKALDLTFVHS
jgi:hypothetical protein